MKRIVFSFAASCAIITCAGQKYSSQAVFAHNDYVSANPFHTAYDLQVGYIEADVFLHGNDLAVAHEKHEIAAGRNLEKLYLQPLLKNLRKHGGSVYEDSSANLTLMIDLKTEGVPTLDVIVNLLEKYPELISCKSLHFMISGNVPEPVLWRKYPEFISFDGRPGIDYTPEQLSRIRMISTSFRNISEWDGHGAIPLEDQQEMRVLVEEAHSKEKKFRFWATPDHPNAWKELMRLNMDVILTDNVARLAEFLEL